MLMKFNRLIPELAVADLTASLDFYVEKLGFRVEFERAEDRFAFLSFEGSQLMIEEDNGGWITANPEFPRGRGINLQIETDNLENIERRVKFAGIPFFRETSENWYRISDETEEGVKEFLIQDVDGYLLRFQQFIGERKVNVEKTLTISAVQIDYRKLKSAESGIFRHVRLECLQKFPDEFGSGFAEEVDKPKLFFEEIVERDSADSFFFGAFARGRLIGIAGFIRGDRAKTQHRGEIVAMYVNPDFRGVRIGENLLRALLEAVFQIERIESVELAVVAENARAVSLYEKIGFETYGLCQNYFKSGGRCWDQKFMQLTREQYLTADRF